MLVALAFLPLAAAGGLFRWQLGERFNDNLPLGTLAANTLACLCLGLLHGTGSTSEVLLGVGFLGALSTWSTLANEVAALHREGRSATALLYLGTTLVFGIASAWLGLSLVG